MESQYESKLEEFTKNLEEKERKIQIMKSQYEELIMNTKQIDTRIERLKNDLQHILVKMDRRIQNMETGPFIVTRTFSL